MSEQITAGKLAEETRSILSGGSAKIEVMPTRRMCLTAVQQARDKAIFQYIYAQKADGNHVVPFDLLDEREVELVPYRDGAMMIELKDRILTGLPKNMGIYQLTTTDLFPEEVIPAPSTYLTMFKGRSSFNLEGSPFYVPVKDKLYVYGISGEGCKLNLKGIYAGATYNETEFFCVPPELQIDIINMAVGILATMQNIPEDIITDNTKR